MGCGKGLTIFFIHAKLTTKIMSTCSISYYGLSSEGRSSTCSLTVNNRLFFLTSLLVSQFYTLTDILPVSRGQLFWREGRLDDKSQQEENGEEKEQDV